MSLTQITAFSQTRIKPTGDTACKKKANPKLVITFGTFAILCLSIGIFMPNVAFAGLFNVTDDLSNWALTFISNLFLKPIVKVHDSAKAGDALPKDAASAGRDR